MLDHLQPAAAALTLLAVGLAASAGVASGAPAFEHAADAEGLAFVRAGDRFSTEPSFVEIMGGGSCWLDADADGDQDLFLVNGEYNDTALAAARQPRSALYRNDGPRAGPDFVDVSVAAGLDVRGWTQACSAADYDGDGLEDLLVVGNGLHWLYRNQGDGTFANVSASSGITADGKCGSIACWGSGAAWADYDRDGCLDVYVINFVAYNMTLGGPRTPGLYDGQPAQLYRNRCDGTFVDVTLFSGTDGDPGPMHGKNWAVTWLDYDLDGWLDIYVASDGVPNILYRNEQDGTFTDVAVEAGVADPRNGMGLVAGDCDDDGDEDLFFTHYSAPQELLWWGWDGFFVNLANGTFEDRSGEGDLRVTEPYIKWGVGWQDLDNDADLDLHVATGGTENGVRDAEQPDLLWTGDGACHWTDARAAAGPPLATELNGRGSAYADWDLDGDVDIVVVNIMDQPAELLRNTGAAGHWLTLELQQPGGNRQAVGARVNVTTPDGQTQHRRLMPSTGIHGSNPAQVHVGLGAATTADVTVVWPGDQVEEAFPGLAADQLLRLHRGGRVQRDTLPPVTRVDVAGTPGEPGWWRSPVTATVAAMDRGVAWTSGVAHTYLALDGGAEQPDPPPVALGEGRHRLRVRSVDADGAAERPHVVEVGVDTVAPVSSVALDGVLDAGVYHGAVGVSFACADAGSGPGRVDWRLDVEAWAAYEGPFALRRPGPHTLTWRCLDVAGNPEAPQALALSQDLGHPATRAALGGTAGLEGWWRGAVEVSLAAEAWPRALAETWVQVDGAPAVPYTSPVVVGGDGVHEVRFTSVDDTGRAEPAQVVEMRIDATPPHMRFIDLGKHVDTPGALVVGPFHRIRAEATDLSGVARLEVRRDVDPFWTPSRPLLFRGEGGHEAMARATDRAGNEGTSARTVVLDLTAPHLAVLRPAQDALVVGDVAVLPLPPGAFGHRAVLVGAPTLEALAEDALAGVAHVDFLVDHDLRGSATAAPWTWRWDAPPAYPVRHVTYLAEDRVGNVAGDAFFVLATGDAGAVLPGFGLGAPPGVLPLALVAGLTFVARGRRGQPKDPGRT